MASNPRLAAGVRPAAGLRRVWRLCRSEHAKAAEFLAAQAVVQKRRQDGAVALAFEGRPAALPTTPGPGRRPTPAKAVT